MFVSTNMFITSSLLYALLATATTGSEHVCHLKSTKAGKSNKAGKSVKSSKACKRPKERAKLPEQCENEFKVINPALPVPNVVSEENVMRYGYALRASGFNFSDIPNYDKWLNDESVLSLAVTGNYQGADNIAEYVNFVNAVDIFDKFYPLGDTGVEFQPILPIVADGDYCMLTTAAVNTMVTNIDATPTAGAVSVDTIVGTRFQFTILDEASTSILVDRIELVSFATPEI